MKLDRMSLAPHVRRAPLLSVSILAVDLLLYVALVFGTVTAESLALRILCALGAGALIGMLAILGHDAGHQSFGVSRSLNRICGTIAFLPALHPLSLWEHHHNRIHHRFTAQIGLDNAFSPMTVDQYLSASRWQKLKYRFLRSLWGQPFSYMIDVWIPHIGFPFFRDSARLTPRNWFDLLLVYAFVSAFLFVTTLGSLAIAGGDWGAAFLNAFLLSFLVPWLVWNALIAFMAIVQHTAPDTKWILPTGQPSTVSQAMAGTVHIVLPRFIDWVFHRVMHHQAHHVNMGVPLQHLVDAQKSVGEANGNRLVHRWTPGYHLELTRQCKLYDPHAGCWLTFDEALVPTRRLEQAA